MKLLKLVRIENLILLAVTQLIFRYGFLELQPQLPLALSHWQYALLVLASVLIAAAGSIMYTISGPDRHNQAISEEKGYNTFIILNVIALSIGAYLSYYIGNIQFVTAFVIASAMLYIGATNFRSTLLVPNILTALTVGLSLLIIGVFNLYPFMQFEGWQYFRTVFNILLDYSYLAITLAFILTLVNDLKNTDEDYNSGKATLSIALGRDRAAKVVFFITIIPVAMILYYGNTYLIDYLYALGFGLIFILGPLIYFGIKLWTAKNNSDYAHLAIVLKLVMLFSAISVLVVTLNLANNA